MLRCCNKDYVFFTFSNLYYILLFLYAMDRQPRIRINASQTAKNFWQIEATVEMESDWIKVANEQDVANTENQHIGHKLLSVIKETEKAFRADGRKIVGDD